MCASVRHSDVMLVQSRGKAKHTRETQEHAQVDHILPVIEDQHVFVCMCVWDQLLTKLQGVMRSVLSDTTGYNGPCGCRTLQAEVALSSAVFGP